MLALRKSLAKLGDWGVQQDIWMWYPFFFSTFKTFCSSCSSFLARKITSNDLVHSEHDPFDINPGLTVSYLTDSNRKVGVEDRQGIRGVADEEIARGHILMRNTETQDRLINNCN